MDHNLEEIIISHILPDLNNGRRNFDLEHTKAVVYWMKYILDSLNKDCSYEKILITAAYAHDWGYVGLFEGIESDNPKEIAKRKPLHMKKGAEKIKNYLLQECTRFFTPKEIERVAHLVSVHDYVEDLKNEDEVTLMEADTLGMLDVKRSPPTFSKEDNTFFVNTQIFTRRIPRFIHENAKKKALLLAQQRLEYYS